MRKLQVALLIIGLIAFVVAAFTTESDLGIIFWRTGIAAMATDVVLLLLWPQRTSEPTIS